MTNESLEDVFNDEFFDEEIEEIQTDPTPVDDSNTDDFFSKSDTEVDDTGDFGSDIVDSLLSAKGIKEGKVKFLDETGQEEEVDFYSLTKEEQLQILNEEAPEENLASIDPAVLNLQKFLDERQLSVDQFLEQYKNEVLEEAGMQQANNYHIDAYTDEELFLLDLKNKFELTDDELIKELERELEDEDLFKRKADALRKEYKDLEDRHNEAERVRFENERQEEYNRFSNQMIDVAVNTSDLYGFELDDNDKNEVLHTLLHLDDNGVSSFYKSLADPQNLYRAAWFLRYGEDAFRMLTDAYEAQIAQYKKEDRKPTVITKENKGGSGGRELSINDIF